MNHFQCLKENHHCKEVILVCLDKNCKDKRLCCILCQAESHPSHLKQLVEMNQLTKFIEQEGQKQNKYPESYNFGQKQQIQGLERLLTLIDSLQKIVKEKIEKIKQQNLTDYLKKVGNSQQGIEYWNKLLEGILQYVEVDNCLIKLTTSKEGELNKMEEQQIKIIQQSEQNLQSIINQIHSNQIQIQRKEMKIEHLIQMKIGNPIQMKIENPLKMKIGKLCFKENRKHVGITIIDQSTIKKTKNDYKSAMAFADEGFDPKNQSYAFAFIIENKTDLWIGVGNDEGGNVPSYLFNNYEKIGHGQYMTGFGCPYHHTYEQFNCNSGKGIYFNVGDKIQIKYDHVSKELEFRKQSGEGRILKMPITDMTKKLYPCAMLCYLDSQVKLVDY